MLALKKILVPTDFSKQSEKAVLYGKELAGKFGAELHLLHAYEATPIMYGEGGGVAPPSTAELQATALKLLNDVDVESNGVAITRKTAEGHALVEIVQYARENDIDLIVMGTHGRGAIAHMLIGSVAENVVRKAPCPVLVVRDEEHDFVMP